MQETFKYKYDVLFNPILVALHHLGGSGSISEIEEEVISILKLSEDEINDIHRESTTKLRYRIAWARNYLKRCDLIEYSARGGWSLTEKGKLLPSVEKDKIKKAVAKLERKENGT